MSATGWRLAAQYPDANKDRTVAVARMQDEMFNGGYGAATEKYWRCQIGGGRGWAPQAARMPECGLDSPLQAGQPAPQKSYSTANASSTLPGAPPKTA